MKKLQWKSPKGIAIIAAAALVVALAVVLTIVLTQDSGMNIVKVPAEDEYVYYNPDETKAEADEGMKVDGVLDEEIYANKNWLHLSNNDAGNQVDIAMTSHFGEKGMYFVFDVTETSPIYVNPDRSPVLNTCIELYLVPPYVSKLNANSIFEIDLLPTGDIAFKKTNGKYGYIDVSTTYDKMAYLGATTKGGEVNTLECYGYVMELYIPWEYMEWLEIDVQAIKDGHMLVNPAHITSHNLTGTDINIDRSWYYYVQQIGTDFTAVTQYFRFDGNGVIGTKEITLEEGEHYSFKGNNVALPGMQVPITIVPEEGYALTSILVDGQEQITKTAFNKDGSVTVLVRCTGGEQKVSASAEAVTPGKKTLSGKVYLNGMKDLLVSYIGPQGEKPVTFDANGNFEIKDLEPGYYELKVEKQGLGSSTHGIYLNRDMYTELVLRVPLFTVTGGSSWILDNADMGILEKLSGAGNIISNGSYNDFTLETYAKYDPELAKLSKDDFYWQQRAGVRIMFSNGKYWHIDLLRENDRYLIQYAKHTGDKSMYSWKNVHTLTEEQIAKYSSAEGIKLTVKRVGNKAAIYLDDKVLFIEELAEEYKDYTAQIGFEAWIANSEIMRIPYVITDSAVLPEAPKIYFYASDTWNVEHQDKGVVYKTGVQGKDTWLDGAIIGNDITTISKDLDPDANNYSMIYIFKFSNGEQFRVRLNHTDNDGKYRIQSMAGSTVFDAWKNHYTLNNEQAQKVQGDGISFRVWISGTTAYVYLDGQQVCTYDLSKVVATGQPSGIEKATATVSLRIDGIWGQTVEVPFVLKQTDTPVEPEKPVEPEEPETPVDPAKKINLTIGNIANGTIKPNKTAYEIGATVKLTITPANGYVQKLYINGKPLLMDWNSNTYTFVATEKDYVITGSFVKALDMSAKDAGRWDTNNQAHGVLTTYYTNETDSWWLNVNGEYTGITLGVKNYLPTADTMDGINGSKGFALIVNVTFDNGNAYAFRIYNDKGTYAFAWYGAAGSTGWGGWKNINHLADKIVGDGVDLNIKRTGDNVLTFVVDGTELTTYTMAGITAANKIVSFGIQQNANVGQYVNIPYTLADTTVEPPVVEPPVVEPPVVEPPVDNPIQLTIPTLANGTVTSNKTAYAVGDTVTLTVTPANGYAQKLFINGEPLLLDWKHNTYSFVATEESYEITGSFEKSLNAVASDSGRWDTANQAHGLLTANYPNNNDSWYMDIQGNYSSIAINAKNYLPVEQSYEGIANGGGFRVVLRMTLDNGKIYAFSIWIDTSMRYVYNHFGAGGSVTGWGGAWCAIADKNPGAAIALNGTGAEFKLERIDGNHMQITLNGTVLETYTIDGVTETNKVVSVGISHYGNKDNVVEIPFEVK